MKQPARPFSISLGHAHEKRLRQIQKKLREATDDQVGNRSEAVQIALLGFNADDRLKQLVKLNQDQDHRRKAK